MTRHFEKISKTLLPALAATLAFPAFAAVAHPSVAATQDAAQLRSDTAALHRLVRRLDADEASLKADAAAGRMSAESRDSYEVYQYRQAVSAQRKVISTDKPGSPQMKADEEAMLREVRRLDAAKARLDADRKEGRMAAVSPDQRRVDEDRMAIAGEKKDIAADTARLKTDAKKS